MSSPVMRHLARARAAALAGANPQMAADASNAHQLLLAQLVEHRRALKDIQSIERKIEAKRAMLPVYIDWLDGTLASGTGAPDVIVTTMMVWCIDVGDYERALRLGQYTLRHNLDLPDQYDRTAAVVLIDEFSQAYLTGKMSIEQASQLLPIVLDLTAEHDAPDQARAKLHKAIGYAAFGRQGPADVDLEQVSPEACRIAIAHCKRALELYDQVGTKKDIERLERRLRQATAEGTPPAPDPVRTPEPGGPGLNPGHGQYGMPGGDGPATAQQPSQPAPP
jgi:hypothetical protein